MNKEKIKENCPLCHDSAEKKVLPYGGYYYLGVQMPLVHCDKCELNFVVHRLGQKEISAFYNAEEYFHGEHAGNSSVGAYEENREIQQAKADFALKKIVRYFRLIPKKSQILDIGCAGGFFLSRARDKYGFLPIGVEYSRRMVQFGREKLQLQIHNGDINSAPLEWSAIDVINMADVLEHVPDPNIFLQSISKRLKKGGLLSIEVPLTYNWTLTGIIIGLINIFRGRWGKQYFLPAHHRVNYVHKPPYHILMFNRSSMRHLLGEFDYKIKYLKVYEGRPKFCRYNALYSAIKWVSHFLTLYLPQSVLGDRMIVIAERL